MPYTTIIYCWFYGKKNGNYSFVFSQNRDFMLAHSIFSNKNQTLSITFWLEINQSCHVIVGRLGFPICKLNVKCTKTREHFLDLVAQSRNETPLGRWKLLSERNGWCQSKCVAKLSRFSEIEWKSITVIKVNHFHKLDRNAELIQGPVLH